MLSHAWQHVLRDQGEVVPEVLVCRSGQLCDVANGGPKEVHHFGALVEGFGAVEEDTRALVDDDQGF